MDRTDTAEPTPRVFISYRRGEATTQLVGRLRGNLEALFGKSGVTWWDHDLKSGASFDQEIDRRIAAAPTFLAVISPGWMDRLNDEHDWVRQEIRLALKYGKLIVPVLVLGAVFPDEGSLPDDIRPLCRRNAARLTDDYWMEGVARIGQAIGGTGNGEDTYTNLRDRLRVETARDRRYYNLNAWSEHALLIGGFTASLAAATGAMGEPVGRILTAAPAVAIGIHAIMRLPMRRAWHAEREQRGLAILGQLEVFHDVEAAQKAFVAMQSEMAAKSSGI